MIDTFAFGMISNNKINGILPIILNQINDEKFYKYNISSRQSLHMYLSGIVTKKQILNTFLSITNALLEAEEYMLTKEDFIFDMKYIYVNVSTGEAFLIAVPLMNEKSDCNLSLFFKEIMFSTQFSETENKDYVAEILNALNQNTTFSILEFRNKLNKIANNLDELQSNKQIQQIGYNQIQNNSEFIKNDVNMNKNISISNISSTQIAVSRVQSDISNKTEPFVSNTNVQNNIGLNDKPVQNNKKKFSSLFTIGGKKNSKQKKEKSAANNINFNIPGKSNVPSANLNSGANGNPTIQNNDMQSNQFAGQKKTNQNSVPNQNLNVNQTPAFNVNLIPNSNQNPVAFGETTVLGNYAEGETAVLSDMSVSVPNTTNAVQAFLVRTKNNEKIPINKQVFKIGKEKSYVDYFIGDNSYISRAHADIIQENGQFYIVDNNSKNFTYINGRKIVGSTKEKASSGDKISFANEEFTFFIN